MKSFSTVYVDEIDYCDSGGKGQIRRDTNANGDFLKGFCLQTGGRVIMCSVHVIARALTR